MRDAEFDRFAVDYEAEHQRSIAFSGCDTDYFARYKVEIAAVHFRALCGGGEALLDFGCGPGTSVPHFRTALPDARIVAADVSRLSIHEAQARHPGQADYQVITGNRLEIPGGDIGLAFAACVFHHVPPVEHRHWMGELHRVVRVGGALVVFEHNPLNPLTRLAVARCAFDRDAVLLRAGVLARRLEESGWQVMKVRYHVFFPQFLKRLRRFELGLGRIPLGGQYSVFAIRR